ncbi:MAG: gliding motility-associated C-terminal domain-containing protein, partial [Bacteroidota bacterium]
PGATYRWQDASTDSVYRVDTLGFYRVVVSREGCTMADSLIVQEDNFACLVDIDCQVLVPNVFTPNDDAINDQFLVRTTCAFTEFKLTIFNRWGDVVYETNNPSIGWDGSTNGVTVSDGVYFWVMDFQHNVVVNADRQRQVGTVTVLY